MSYGRSILPALLLFLPFYSPAQTLQQESVLAVQPLRFEPNQGQAASGVLFQARGAGYSLALTRTEAVIAARNGKPARMRWVGGKAAASVEGLDRLPGVSNYIVGRDSSRWRSGIPGYGKVRYRSLYPGVDLVLYGRDGQLEYDLVVRPGADLAAVRLAFDGAQPRLESGGDLVIGTGPGAIRHRRPHIYQEVDGVRRTVAGGFRMLSRSQVGFRAEGYDPKVPLVVDPVIAFSTYLGGSGGESSFAVTTDSAGNVYLTGWTASSDFPLASPLNNAVRGQDVFVTKINAANNALVYSTYIGGGGSESGFGIAVDAAGNAYVGGDTTSTDFPVVGAIQSTAQNRDAFVLKLNPAGGALIYSTYLGGSNADRAYGLAVDDQGSAYVTGFTESADFPTRNPIQAAYGGSRDVFIAKLAANGSSLVYSTFLGGAAGEVGNGLALDAGRNVYVAGYTGSIAFPLVNAYQNRRGGSQDFSAFVSKVNAAGSALVYSTYLGGSSDDWGHAIAVSPSGEAWVAGITESADFPVAKPVQNSFRGVGDIFLSKLSASGSTLPFSTWLGGSGDDVAYGVVLDANGNVTVAGATESDDFPSKSPIGVRRLTDMVAARFTAAGELTWASPIGGSDDEGANAIGVDGQGNVYLAGYSYSTDFPLAGALQQNLNGGVSSTGGDAALVKLSDSGTPPPPSVSMVSAASFATGAMAPESIVSAYGQGLAPGVVVAESAVLPDTLAGVMVKVTDANGTERTAPLFFVSPGQINFLVPPGTATGQATVTVQRDGATVAAGTMTIAAVSPGLFTANANGQGVAAAIALKVAADGTQSSQIIFQCAAAGACTGVPIDPGGTGEDVYLLLYGTGIRGRSSDANVHVTLGGEQAEVLAAVAQGQYMGLDQVNVRLPKSLSGRGSVDLVMTVDGRTANTATVTVGGQATPVPPVLTSAAPATLTQGQTVTAFALSGANLAAVTSLEFSPSTGITASNVRATATSVTAQVVVATTAPTGNRSVTVTSPAGRSNALTVAVQSGQPGTPVITTLNPAFGSRMQTIASFTITGTNLAGATAIEFSPADSITVSNLSATATSVTAQVVVGQFAALGARTVAVVTPAGRSNALNFEVRGVAPTITSLSPSVVTQGQTIRSFIVRGTRLLAPTGFGWISPSQGITVPTYEASADMIVARVIIAADAAVGTRSVTITTDEGVSNTVQFEIRAAATAPAGVDYLPVSSGTTWDYGVKISTDRLPYRPAIEAPAGMLCASIICGYANWSSANWVANFRLSVGEKTGAADEQLYRLTATDPGGRFLFNTTDPDLGLELRKRVLNGDTVLEAVGSLSPMKLARALARIQTADLNGTMTITVPAGTFQNVIQTSITLNGDGTYVVGSYPTDVYLAPGIGIIRAVQKNEYGNVLYLMELTGSSLVAGAPRIDSLEPSSGSQGQTIDNFTVKGENLGGGSIEFSPASSITISNVSASANQVTAQISITAAAATGNRNVIVRTAAGASNTLPFNVRTASPIPNITKIEPADLVWGQQDTIYLTGTSLAGATTVTFSDASNLRIVDSVTASSTSVSFKLAVDAGATPGERTLTVTSPAGQSNAVTFTIRRGSPRITSFEPGVVYPDRIYSSTFSLNSSERAQFLIRGVDLGGVQSVEFIPADGIRLVKSSLQFMETIGGWLYVDATAALGPRRVRVTSPGGTSEEFTFEIQAPPAGAPVISNVSLSAPTSGTFSLNYRGRLDFTDSDGDIQSGTGGAIVRVTLVSANSGSSVLTLDMTGSFLNKAGQQSGTVDINYTKNVTLATRTTTPVQVAVTLIDAGDRPSNTVIVTVPSWWVPLI